MARCPDGRFASVATGQHWRRQRLLRTERGRYLLETAVYGVADDARRRLTKRQAAAWLRRQGYRLPVDLADD
jgi:hypothetical protein